jgi:hypothetical protein
VLCVCVRATFPTGQQQMMMMPPGMMGLGMGMGGRGGMNPMMAAMMGGGGMGAGMGMGGRGGAGGRGRGGRSNVWTPDASAAAGASPGGGGGGGRGRGAPTTGPTSKVWVRPGAEIAGNGGGMGDDKAGAPTLPCSFFAQGSCRYGDACRFSHDPNAVAAAAGDGADSDAADAGDDELPEIDIADTQ